MWQEEQAAIMIQTAVFQDLTTWVKKWHGVDCEKRSSVNTANLCAWIQYISIFCMFDVSYARGISRGRNTETKVPLCWFTLNHMIPQKITFFHKKVW